ncbi:SAM-dependent methyltransferase [Actinomadura roseirufa]|uniref:SAM-dependent methyltransferase n=1 Tax=Actinomadura roseirufa TaxID=2094049 RepID=UPI001041A6DE|nr:class I SAM-dependent methyltransferase [Actinomadura roseirufa]
MADLAKEYYRSRTDAIIERFGPGPRVHFHNGYIEKPGVPPEATLDELRDSMNAFQEKMLKFATDHWRSFADLSGRVLDAGCGLGGTSIWLAQNFGADVTSVTNVAEHIPLINTFAAQAEVAELVHPHCSDIHTFAADPGRYDAVVALEASCFFDRHRWFSMLSSMLRPGGHVLIEDVFLGAEPGWKNTFDATHHTDVGSVEEYHQAADAAGFRFIGGIDISSHMADFADWTIAWNALRATQPGADTEGLKRAIEAQRALQRVTGREVDGIRGQLLAYELAAPSL